MDGFNQVHFTLAGSPDVRTHITDGLLSAIPTAPPAVTAFAGQISDGTTAFQSRVLFSQMPAVALHWRPLGGTAGVAHVACDGEPATDLLLLLSGNGPATEAGGLDAAQRWWSGRQTAARSRSLPTRSDGPLARCSRRSAGHRSPAGAFTPRSSCGASPPPSSGSVGHRRACGRPGPCTRRVDAC